MIKKLLTVSIAAIVVALFATPVQAAGQPSSWAASEVQTAIGLGLVPGELQSDYTRSITRVEFASLIMKLPRMRDNAVEKLKTTDPVAFSDTTNQDVIYCAVLGIVEGDGKGHFMPQDFLTRQQAAKMLYKTCSVFAPWVINEDTMITTIWRGYASCEMPHSWADGAGIRSYARESVNWCYRHNVITGMGENTFAPEGRNTREQAILTALRLYYTDGRASSNLVQNGPDYYPIYEDENMIKIRSWIDSSLNTYSEGEVDQAPMIETETLSFDHDTVALGSGVYALQNTDTEISVFDAFGDTLSTITTAEPVIFVGSSNGLLYLQSQSEARQMYYTQTGKALPPF